VRHPGGRAPDRPDSGIARLRAACARLPFEPHDIAGQLDRRGRYAVELEHDFPLSIRLFRYTSLQHTPGTTWHERLELFLALDGEVRLRVGRHDVALAPGDLLLVGGMQPHGVIDFPGFDARVVVTSFMPALVAGLGATSHDHAYLLPFCAKADAPPRVVRSDELAASPAALALALLVECFFGDQRAHREAGCKAYLLELLFHLARHFGPSPLLQGELVRQQRRALRLRGLLEHIREHHAERLSVEGAARLAGMRPSQMRKTFKRVAGMSLLQYLNHVRLARAAQLLRETELTVAAVAMEVGFVDQSYFDRRFRREFGQTPSAFRARPSGAALTSTADLAASGRAPHRPRSTGG
jgi:AraC-like DNA-binding protein/mannose-6-phosphate isomerase-like protein (cupin superfamily)